MLCIPMIFPILQNKRFWKKITLSLGCSICCSSVTYNRKKLKSKDVFISSMKSSLDWDIFLHLANMSGRFVYERKTLMCFRIHEKSTSMNCIVDNVREKEDYQMFCKIWPKSIARFLMVFYKKAYNNYTHLVKGEKNEM